jgi:hypothetical protein
MTTMMFMRTKLLVPWVLARGKNSINIIFWSLFQDNCPEKTDAKCRAGSDSMLGSATTQHLRMGANSGIFRPKVNNESSSSGLFSGSLIARLLVLRICEKENKILDNPRAGPGRREVDRGLGARSFRPPSISIRRIDSRIGICYGTYERILPQTPPTRPESYLQFSRVRAGYDCGYPRDTFPIIM